jgi:hypothetical protein
MSRVEYKKFEQPSFGDFEVYSVLPEHPIWSKVDELIDFSFADQICASLYSSRGQRPYAPSLKLKLHIVQRYYNLSDREMEERVIGDLFIKRFLGLPVKFTGFDHSTIGLDRDRVGSDLFNACHHFILAQAKQKGLWGDNKDVWLVDSFHTNGHIAFVSCFRLIKQGILRLLNHLKRANRQFYELVQSDLDLRPLTSKLPSEPTIEEIEMSFSQLVVLAFGLLHWFESETISPIFWSWEDKKRQLASLENQAVLYQILTENIHPEKTDDPQKPYKKLDRKKRPDNRIVSAVDIDVRNGQKSKKIKFLGDKIQVVTSYPSGLVLNAEPIPGNEADGVRMLGLIDEVIQHHEVKPQFLVADSAYGYARYRRILKGDISFVSPLQNKPNPTGLYTNEQFTYDIQAQTVTCPEGIVTGHSIRNNKSEGVQFKFPKIACDICPVKEKCTTNKGGGRTIFISDYYEEIQEAALFNNTEQAKQLMSARKSIEPKNNELKNHNGLGNARFRTQEKRRIDAKIVGMVVNLKQLIKHAGGSLTLGFSRKKSIVV